MIAVRRLFYPSRVRSLLGEHGQSAVLDLLDLELCQGVGVVTKAEWVEGATWVQGVESLNTWALAVGTVGLSASHEDDLQATSSICPSAASRGALVLQVIVASLPQVISQDMAGASCDTSGKL